MDTGERVVAKKVTLAIDRAGSGAFAISFYSTNNSGAFTSPEGQDILVVRIEVEREALGEFIVNLAEVIKKDPSSFGLKKTEGGWIPIR